VAEARGGMMNSAEVRRLFAERGIVEDDRPLRSYAGIKRKEPRITPISGKLEADLIPEKRYRIFYILVMARHGRILLDPGIRSMMEDKSWSESDITHITIELTEKFDLRYFLCTVEIFSKLRFL
jgi:hypothetical protein